MFPRPVSTPRASGLGVGIAVLGAGALFAVLAGAGTALIGPMAAAVFAAMLLGIVALFLPIRWLVVGLVLVSFLITGQLIYFARIDKALWFPFLVGALMLVRFPLDRMQRGHRPLHEAEAAPLTPTAMKVCIALYMATLLSSTLFNGVPPLQMLVSFKEYLFLWGLFLVLAAGLVRPDFVLRIWSVLPWLMVLQLPLIAYQRFVVAPSRRNIGAAWDAVVGAFGGNPMAGGSSGAMGLFCVVMILVVIARWRAGLLPLWQTLLLGLSGLLGIGLAEIKFAVLLLPIGFALLFLREFARRPMQGLVAVAVGVALAGAILVGYQAQYGRADKGETTEEYFESMFSSSTDANFVNLRTREIGRVAALRFWVDKHDLDDQPSRRDRRRRCGQALSVQHLALRAGDAVVGDRPDRHGCLRGADGRRLVEPVPVVRRRAARRPVARRGVVDGGGRGAVRRGPAVQHRPVVQPPGPGHADDVHGFRGHVERSTPGCGTAAGPAPLAAAGGGGTALLTR
jgi:hypothetical protein